MEIKEHSCNIDALAWTFYGEYLPRYSQTLMLLQVKEKMADPVKESWAGT